MIRSNRLPGPPRLSRLSAFTLVELLLAVALGSLVLAGITALAVSMIRASVQEESSQVAQDAWSRVQQFLLTEVGEAGRSYSGTAEAVPIELATSISGCTGSPAPPALASFSIRVRNPGNPGAAPAQIFYYNQNGNLMRCGPPVLADGSLAFTASSSVAILSYNTSLSNLSIGHFGRSLAYTVTISSPRGTTLFSGRGRAWAKSALIEAES